MTDPAPRYDIQLTVRLSPAGPGDDFTGVSQNISETGVLVLAEQLQPQGTTVDLEFRVFKGTGKVIWTQDLEGEVGVLLGLKFVSLSRNDRKELVHLLESPELGRPAPSEGSSRQEPKPSDPTA